MLFPTCAASCNYPSQNRPSSPGSVGGSDWASVTPGPGTPGLQADQEATAPEATVDQLKDLTAAEPRSGEDRKDGPPVTQVGSQDHWEVREANDFRYGPQEFGSLPFWAHFVPAALAQFHTILTLNMFSQGFVFMLGLCRPDGHDHGVVWWPTGGCPSDS